MALSFNEKYGNASNSESDKEEEMETEIKMPRNRSQVKSDLLETGRALIST